MPNTTESTQTSELLHRWSRGDEGARDQLIEILYPQLRRLAAERLRGEAVTLQPTELVHEIYLRLLGQDRTSYDDSAHFFAIAARLLRRVVVDHVRHRRRAKRDRGQDVPLEAIEVEIPGPEDVEHSVDVLALDQALERLARIDETASRVVELRYFAGLSHDETAAALGVGRATVGRSWRFARAWLRGYLEIAEGGEPYESDRAT